MHRYWVSQHLIVLNLYNVSINQVLVTEFIAAKVSQNLLQNQIWWRICQQSEINNLVGTIKTNRMQKTTEYETNEQSRLNTKYSYMQNIEICK